jgi:hypothetical protein
MERAGEKPGQPIDGRLPEPRATDAARRLRTHASRRPGVPATLTLAGRKAHEAALQRDQAAHRPCIVIRQVK